MGRFVIAIVGALAGFAAMNAIGIGGAVGGALGRGLGGGLGAGLGGLLFPEEPAEQAADGQPKPPQPPTA